MYQIFCKKNILKTRKISSLDNKQLKNKRTKWYGYVNLRKISNNFSVQICYWTYLYFFFRENKSVEARTGSPNLDLARTGSQAGQPASRTPGSQQASARKSTTKLVTDNDTQTSSQHNKWVFSYIKCGNIKEGYERYIALFKAPFCSNVKLFLSYGGFNIINVFW